MTEYEIITPWVPDPSTDFGARLALVRHEAGWTNVKRAATTCGVDAESWRAWEQQGRRPRNFVEVCEAISAISGVDLVWLMTGNSLLPRRDSNLQPSAYLHWRAA